MPDEFLEVKIEGIEKLTANLKAFGDELRYGLEGAGQQAAAEILDTQGLRKYPPLTAANQPPTPYYIRGKGTEYAGHNSGKSEHYGEQFTVKQENFVTYIGNSASYARYLGGNEQARAMAGIGWRKLIDVAREKLPQIKAIYQAWINQAISRLGL